MRLDSAESLLTIVKSLVSRNATVDGITLRKKEYLQFNFLEA